jgi:hypothetical protein
VTYFVFRVTGRMIYSSKHIFTLNYHGARLRRCLYHVKNL